MWGNIKLWGIILNISMAMTAENMSTLIVDTILPHLVSYSSGSTNYSIVRNEMISSWTYICEGLIEYIQANAKVTVTMANHTHTGVLTGSGVSGPPVVGPTATEYGDPTIVPSTGGIS